MGQGGNVYEWEETDFDLVNGPTPSSSAGALRGGNWSNDSGFLLSLAWGFNNPTVESSSLGFRVASIAIIPEPSTAALAASAFALLTFRRRRRRG